MLKRCALLLAVISCVQPIQRDGFLVSLDNDFHKSFALWPSFRNAALVRIRRASQATQTQESADSPVPVNPVNTQGPSEGVGVVKPPADGQTEHALAPVQTPIKDKASNVTKEKPAPEVASSIPKNSSETSNKIPKDVQEVAPSVAAAAVPIKDNGTNAEKATKEWELSPEATKRGLIVFGGFALLAMAYFIFYRTKSKYNESGNSNGPSESNQFRYGVLESDDRRDNLELSRVPLTMESDEEEDEDLEIFDLEQKKKSLSYVNLQATDEDIVLSPRNEVRDQLLLDIEDENNDTLINWTNSSNRTLL